MKVNDPSARAGSSHATVLRGRYLYRPLAIKSPVFPMPRVPRRLSQDVTRQGLNLSPDEEHLLSVVDGELNEQELAFMTGHPPSVVRQQLGLLVEYGLVEYSGAAAIELQDRSSGDSTKPNEDIQAEADADEAEIELDEDIKRRARQLFKKLDECDYYELLEIGRDADKGEIKSAFYRLAPEFHPDKYFRKNLGDYKRKFEAIFARLTQAYDTLRARKRRQRYDASLPPEKKATPPEEKATPPEKKATTAGTATSEPTRSSRSGSKARPSAPYASTSERRRIDPAAQAEVGAPSDPGGSRIRSDHRGSAAPRTGRSSTPGVSDRPSGSGRPSRSASSSFRTGPSNPARRSDRPSGRGVGRRSGGDVNSERNGPAGGSVPDNSAKPSYSSVPPPNSDRARRVRADALARRLRAIKRSSPSVAPPAESEPPPPSPEPSKPIAEPNPPEPADGVYKPMPEVGQSVAEMFRERFDKLHDRARQRRAEKYAREAQAALDRGEYNIAARAFRLAATLSPDDPVLRRRAEQAEKLAGD